MIHLSSIVLNSIMSSTSLLKAPVKMTDIMNELSDS